MRALTVQQPWAWAIVHGGKDVENRTRNLAGSYRGPLAIHAGLREDEAAYDDDMIRSALGEVDDSWLLEERLATGVVLGVVDLVAVHHETDHGPGSRCSWWGQRGIWHLQLANARPLAALIAAKGRLGLWTPDAGLVAAIRKQVPA